MNRLTLVWLTSGLLIASAASAQPPSAQVEPAQAETAQSASAPTASVSDNDFKIPIMIWAGAVMSDQVTTYRFSSQYPGILHETNPLIRGLDDHPALLVAAGTAMDATMAWALQRLWGKRHPRLVKIAFYAAAAYRTHLAFHNMRMMEHARRISPSRSGSTLPR